VPTGQTHSSESSPRRESSFAQKLRKANGLPYIDPKLPEFEQQVIVRTHRFLRMFGEAFIRVHPELPMPVDYLTDSGVVTDFMRANPQTQAWNLVATAIISWDLAAENPKPIREDTGDENDDEALREDDYWKTPFDVAFHCRRAGTVRGLLRSIGQINAEIKNHDRENQTYETLRGWFCHCELEEYGWTNNNALGLIDPDNNRQLYGCWERKSRFREFYRTQRRPLPEEMATD